MIVQDRRDKSQSRVVEVPPENTDENVDPVLRDWSPRTARKTVGLRCDKRGSSEHSGRFCGSLYKRVCVYDSDIECVIKGLR